MRARAFALLGVVVCMVACAGTPTPPVTEPEARAEAATAPAPAEPEPELNAGATEADVTAIVQLVVDDPELDKYLHLGEKGRFPLQVSGQKLPSGLKVVKSTEPVKVVEGPKSNTDAVLVITDLDVQGDKASVRYRYDVEGVRGTVTLARSGQGWELKSSRIVER